MSRSSFPILLTTLLSACAAGRAPSPAPSPAPVGVPPAGAQAAGAVAGTGAAGSAASEQPASVSDGRQPAARTSAAVAPASAQAAPVEAQSAVAQVAPGESGISPAASAEAPAPQADAERGLSGAELSLWSDPAFRLRFTESYLSDTTVEPTPSDEEVVVLAEFNDLMAAGRQDKALQVLEKRRSKGCSALIDCYVANLRMQREEPDAAAAAYRVAVGKFPKFRRAWRGLAFAEARRESYPEALQAAVRTIELEGANGDLYGILGICHMQLENYVAAESAYRLANMLEPTNPEWEAGMAMAFFRQGRFPEAIALFDGMLQRRPDDAYLWLSQGKAYLAAKRPLEAAQNFEVAHSLGAATTDSLGVLGSIYINEGITELGAEAYLAALALDSAKMAGPALTAAKSLLMRFDAVEDAERLLALVDASGLSLEEQKERLDLLGKISATKDPNKLEGLEFLQQIVALDPMDGDALIRLAAVYSARGEVEQALFHFERASGIEAFEEKGKLAQGQFLVKQQRYSEGLPLLRRALDLRRARNEAGTGRKDSTEGIEALIQYAEKKSQARAGAG